MTKSDRIAIYAAALTGNLVQAGQMVQITGKSISFEETIEVSIEDGDKMIDAIMKREAERNASSD